MCVGLTGCKKGVGSRISKGKDGANTVHDGAVDLLHGAGVERNSHLCIKDH